MTKPSQVTSCRQESRAQKPMAYIFVYTYIYNICTNTMARTLYVYSALHMYAKLYQNIQISIDFAVKLT